LVLDEIRRWQFLSYNCFARVIRRVVYDDHFPIVWGLLHNDRIEQRPNLLSRLVRNYDIGEIHGVIICRLRQHSEFLDLFFKESKLTLPLKLSNSVSDCGLAVTFSRDTLLDRMPELLIGIHDMHRRQFESIQ